MPAIGAEALVAKPRPCWLAILTGEGKVATPEQNRVVMADGCKRLQRQTAAKGEYGIWAKLESHLYEPVAPVV